MKVWPAMRAIARDRFEIFVRSPKWWRTPKIDWGNIFLPCFFLYRLSWILYPILFHILGWEDKLNCLKMRWMPNGLLEIEHDLGKFSRGGDSGIAPAKFPGRGLGLLTDRSIKHEPLVWNSNSFRDLHGQHVDSNTLAGRDSEKKKEKDR
jgi:hypothetical protein